MMAGEFLRGSPRRLWVKKNWVISGSLLSALAAALISLFIPNVYQAKAVLQVFYNRPAANIGSIDTPAIVIREISKAPEIVNQLKERLNIKNVSVEKLSKLLVIKILEFPVSITQSAYLPTITLITQNKDKKLAMDLANAWAEILCEKVAKYSGYGLKKAQESFSRELEISENKLVSNMAALASLRKSTNVEMSEIALEAKKEDLLRLEFALNDALISRDFNEKGKSKGLFEQENYFTDLIEKTKKDIVATQDKIYESKIQMENFEREIEALRQNCLEIYQKRNQLMMSMEENMERLVVVSGAIEPSRHIRPDRARITALAGCFGFILSCLVVLFKPYFSKQI